MMAGLTVETVLEIATGTRQDIERAKAARLLDEWKADLVVKELDNLVVILRLLRSSTDGVTRQAILKQIFTRTTEIRQPFEKDNRDNNSRGGVGGGNEAVRDRLQRAQSDRKIQLEQEAEARAQRLQKEREEKEKVMQRVRNPTNGGDERLPRAAITSNSESRTTTATVLPKPIGKVGDDLGLTVGPGKDSKHMEWDAEIRRLNGVVDQKVQNMNERKSPRPTRYSAATVGSRPGRVVAIPSVVPRESPTASSSIFAKPPPRQQDPKPQAKPALQPSASCSLLEKIARPSASLTTTTSPKESSGSDAKIAGLLQQAGKDAALAVQILQKAEDDFLALNGAIRAMILGFNTCTELLTRPTEAGLRQRILDVCMAVLAAAKEYFTLPSPTTKAAVGKEIERAVAIVKSRRS